MDDITVTPPLPDIAELIGLLGTADILIAAHQADARGRCRKCSAGGDSSSRIMFPCNLYLLAQAARSG